MTSRFARPCLVCGTLTNGTRCPQHQRELNIRRERKKDTPERRAKKRLLYGSDYQRRRAETLANATVCHICQKPFTPYDKIEADHLVPGHPDSPLAPAHRLCNQQRGNRPLP